MKFEKINEWNAGTNDALTEYETTNRKGEKITVLIRNGNGIIFTIAEAHTKNGVDFLSYNPQRFAPHKPHFNNWFMPYTAENVKKILAEIDRLANA